MKNFGRALMILAGVALVIGAWLLYPGLGWVVLALILYVAGYHLSNRDGDGPTAGAEAEPVEVVHEAGRSMAEAVRLHQEVSRASAIHYGVAVVPRRLPEA